MTDAPMTIQKLASRMAEVLTERGWYQGTGMMNGDGKLDLLGARDIALFGFLGSVPDNPLRFDFNRVALSVLDVRSLAAWNDAPERTFKDVLDLLAAISAMSGEEVQAAIRANASEVAEAITAQDEIDKAWQRQADAMGMTVEEVKLTAAVMAGVQSFANDEREPSVILLPEGSPGGNYAHICGISVRYTSGVSKPTLGFELET